MLIEERFEEEVNWLETGACAMMDGQYKITIAEI
jgi:hypothetical protein